MHMSKRLLDRTVRKNQLLIVRWQGPISVQYRPYKLFLLFQYLRGVLFKNLNDATLSSLGNPPTCKLRPPLRKFLLSSISQSLCMISK